MLDDCLSELGVDTNATTFVGDSLKDMQAALAANCQPILVQTKGSDNRVQTELAEQARSIGVREVVADLSAAVERILLLNQGLRARQ